MTTFTKSVVALFLCLFVANVSAQEKDKKQDSVAITAKDLKATQINKLKAKIADIEAQEREFLKTEIEAINKQLDQKKITAEKAELLKKEAAKKHALNIQDRVAIINKKIDLIERNDYKITSENEDESVEIAIGTEGLKIDIKNKKKTSPKYDIRTTNKMMFAIGFNNTIGKGQSLEDSPYKLGGSGFVELGLIWQTRLFKNSNFARINYGLTAQWNKLDIKDNKTFVKNGDLTTLETFPFDVKKAKFRTTNLVVPVHLEFGASRKKDYGNKIRYYTNKNLKFGVGGFGGVRLATMQKVKYKGADGDRVKSKERRDFNTSNFVYGVSGYIGYGDLSLYAKYNLNPLFKDQALDQHNISLGLRWAWD